MTAGGSSSGRSGWLPLAGALLALAAFGAVLGVGLERLTASDVDTSVDRLAELPTDPVAPRPPARPPPPHRSIALDGMPGYPGAAPQTLDDEVSVFGMPMAIAWFPTRDPPAQVVSYYRDALVKDGYAAVTHMYGPQAGYAGWMDYETGRMHLVSAIVQGDETLVFVSLSEPEQLNLQALPPGVPLPKETQGVSSVRMVTEGRPMLVVSGRLPQDLDQAGQLVKRTLEEGGWTVEDEEQVVSSNLRLSARLLGQTATVVLSQERTHRDVGLLMTFTGS